jgi:hypothetical protein
MNPLDMIIERTAEDQKFFVERVSKELLRYGYSVVLSDWLSKLPVARRVEAMEGVR